MTTRDRLFAVLAAAAILLAAVAPARAGLFDPASSELTIRFGHFASSSQAYAVVVPAGGGGTASFDAPVLTDTAGLFQSTGTVGTGLFTGIAILTNLSYTVTNQAGSFAPGGRAAASTTHIVVPGGDFGGVEPLNGLVNLLPISFIIPLHVVGGSGIQSATSIVFGQLLSAQGAGFGTGPAVIKSITTLRTVGGGVPLTRNLSTVGTLVPGSYVNTVTLSGGITRGGVPITPGQIGTGASTYVTLVAPLRFGTSGLGGDMAMAVSKTFHFVPEPGALFLAGPAMAALIAVGRRKGRRPRADRIPAPPRRQDGSP